MGKRGPVAHQTAWTPSALVVLRAGYPTGMPLKAIAAQVRHHTVEVRRMAEELGLVRRKPVRRLAKKTLETTENISFVRFVVVSFEEVVGWLRKHGHKVKPDTVPGLWQVGPVHGQTPQMVVKLANDKRCRHHGLPPFQVDTGGRTPTHLSDTRIHSLTGSSMELQLARMGK